MLLQHTTLARVYYEIESLAIVGAMMQFFQLSATSQFLI